VNILILEENEIGARLPRSDRRWAHVKKVLKKRPGERIAAGLVCEAHGPAPGRLGEAVIRELDDSGMVLEYEPFQGAAGEPPELAPIRLILGFPRPIQAARMFKDLASLGVSEILLTGTELGEKSYLQSDFFKKKDFRLHLIEGAEQAANPRLPSVSTYWSLARCLEQIEMDHGSRYFFHPYGGTGLFGAGEALDLPVTLAIGSERGWTERETALLEEYGFERRSLGARILKSETAALSAVVLALAALGRM
jgi:RsmE family RNA methyltransferase